MGAGAVVLHRETQQHEDFITWIPPICKSSWKQPVSSMFSEIIAAHFTIHTGPTPTWTTVLYRSAESAEL